MKSHGLCLVLLLPGGVGVGAEGEARIEVSRHGGHRMQSTIFQQVFIKLLWMPGSQLLQLDVANPGDSIHRPLSDLALPVSDRYAYGVLDLLFPYALRGGFYCLFPRRI